MTVFGKSVRVLFDAVVMLASVVLCVYFLYVWGREGFPIYARSDGLWGNRNYILPWLMESIFFAIIGSLGYLDFYIYTHSGKNPEDKRLSGTDK